MIVLRSTDDATEVALEPGATFDVTLPENATTGYQWQIHEQPDGVELISDEPIPPADLRPGAGGEHRFRFHVRGEPAGPLTLELRRSWESEREPEQRFSVTIVPPGRR